LLILGIYILILLLPLAAARNRLPGTTFKLLLLPLLLIPVIIIDLAGATVPVILILLGIQVCYLIVVKK
jgi:hypothetical protein